MQLVLFSYYQHYHISQLAVKHALKHIPNIDSIVIIWDNTHDITPKIPLYDTLPLHPIQISWNDLNDDIIIKNGNGWFNQQLIKLHLDLILEKKDYIVMDGDMILNQDIDPYHNLYATQIPQNHERYNHLQKVLGLYHGDFMSCPFMYIKSAWLKNIRRMCEINTGFDIKDVLIKHSPQVYEWGLIANYLLYVLKKPIRVEPFYYKIMNAENLEKQFNDVDNFVLAGNDLLTTDFWKDHGVVIDNNIYSANMFI